MVAHSYPTDYEIVLYNGKVSLIFIVINKMAEKVSFEMD